MILSNIQTHFLLQLIKLREKAGDNGEFIDTIENFTNLGMITFAEFSNFTFVLGPILDFCVVEERQGELSLKIAICTEKVQNRPKSIGDVFRGIQGWHIEICESSRVNVFLLTKVTGSQWYRD